MAHEYRNIGPSGEGDGVTNEREKRKHDRCAQDPRYHKFFHRINPVYPENVNLMPDDHGANLGSHPRAYSSGKTECDGHRPDLSDDGDPDDLPGVHLQT